MMPMTHRPVLIGMNNPISSRPEYVLWPDPPGCTGWRLWKMLHDRNECTKRDYLRAFTRLNLVTGQRWDATSGRRAARLLRVELRGRVVVLLGQEVRAAFGIPRLLIHPQV